MAASTTRTVKAKFDGDARGMIAAAKEGEQAIDKLAKDSEKKMRASGDKSGKAFGSGLKKWFTGEGGGLFKEIGRSGGTVFGSGLLGALKTPILGPALLAAISGVALTVLPAAGAVAGGALVSGFGLGLAGLGLVFAAKSDVVVKKWQQTTAQLGADMRLIAKPFESTLVRIADIFERTVDRFNPHLAKAFAEMAGPVGDFVDDTATALEQLIPAIDPVTDALDEVLDSLGPAMQGALADVSAGISDLARSVEQNPEALADMVRGLGDIARTSLDLVTTLNDVNGKFEDLTGGVSLVDVALRGLQATMAPLIGLFSGLEKGIDLVNAMTHSTEASGASMSEAAAHTARLAQGYTAAGAAAKGNTAVTETLAQKYDRQKRATDSMLQSLFALQNGYLSLSGAQISYQAAVDDATAAAKENGKTLDINTAKGRANRTALNQVAQAANEQTESMIRNGRGQVAAAQAATQSRASFVRLGVQMGLSKKQAQAMAAQLIAIPNVTRTAKLNANKRDLEVKLAAAKRELASKDLTRERRAQLTAEISRLEAGVAAAQRALNSLPASRTVTLTTRQVTVRSIINQTATGGGRAPGHASGGLLQPNRTYLVGERGPEPLTIGPDGFPRVTSNESAPREILQPAPQPMVAEIHIEIGGEVVRVVRTEIKADKRDTKRRVGAR